MERLLDDNRDPEVIAFIKEVLSLCKKRGYSISHEDGQGGFEIWKFNLTDYKWFKSAIQIKE